MEKMIDSMFDWLDGPGKPLFWVVIAFSVGYFVGIFAGGMQ